MAATAFTLYGKAKKKIGNGTIRLGVGNYRFKLCTSAASAAVNARSTRSTLASCTPEISARGGYVAGGRLLTTPTWGSATSANIMKFDAVDRTFTASLSSLINCKYGVIGVSTTAGAIHALCFTRLTSGTQFTVTSPNTLTIVFDALGIFTLT